MAPHFSQKMVVHLEWLLNLPKVVSRGQGGLKKAVLMYFEVANA